MLVSYFSVLGTTYKFA